MAILAWGYFVRAGYLTTKMDKVSLRWFVDLLRLLAPSVDRLDQLPARASLIFIYDAQAAVRGEEVRHALEDAGAREVLKAFIPKVLAESTLTYERFREITKAVQKETGKKGKDLYHPIRMAVTGAGSGPELEKLIPIYEEGSKLLLARHVKSVSERLREFAEAAKL